MGRYLLGAALLGVPACLPSLLVPAAHAKTAATFPLVAERRAPTIHVDAGDATVVSIAAKAFAGDVQAVSGTLPQVSTAAPSGDLAIVAGTIGKSAAIDRLVAEGKLSVAAIKGQAEGYVVAVVDGGVPGVGRALVIAGADRRGTAYGIFHLSRMIGVSPWTWWADVKPQQRATIDLAVDTITQKSPSVKYRGFFINDEDWSIRPWAEEKDPTGTIGPKTYAQVCELLLRLRANLLWPAMHKVTTAFNLDAQNAKVADDYAIVMGASHAEPMLRNNVGEWSHAERGEYNYDTNGPAVLEYWRERVKTNGAYENLYTIGMRGIHDSAIVAGHEADGVKLLEKVVADQRELFRSELGRDPATVPQVFVPYKEVLDVYRKGMKVPEDAILGWVDDNHGYIRQLSTSAEQKRPGGGGVYYHISYWGKPNDYLWLDSTPPALIGEEMGKAYATNARAMWMLNVGDIKPGEKGAEYFLDLAYDFDGTSRLGQHDWLKQWASRTFGAEQAGAIADVLGEYYRLNFARKPEHMGYNDEELGIQGTDMSPVAYGDEADRRVAAYLALDAKATQIAAALPQSARDGFFQLVQYPIRGSAGMNEKILSADRSFLYAWQGRASTNLYAERAVAAFRSVKAATATYNVIGDGKWTRFMDDAPRYQSVFSAPPVGKVAPSASAGLGIAVEGSVDALVAAPAKAEADYGLRMEAWRNKGARADSLPAFVRATGQRHFIDVFATGTAAPEFTVTASDPWIRVDRSDVRLGGDVRVWISIDWARFTGNTQRKGQVVITGGGIERAIAVVADPMTAPAGTLVEDNGVVSIEPHHYAMLRSRTGGWRHVPGLGRSGHALESGAQTPSATDASSAPYAEYRFVTRGSGAAKLRMGLVPTFPLNAEHGLRYAVSIDGAPPQVVDVEANKNWDDAVQRATSVTSTDWTLGKPGAHTLRVYAMDPCLVLDSIVVDLGGLQKSYMPPPETVARKP
ncbi:glycosyl hydrolase 115 family protein [Novosphingobium kaempferiae]|uniref:glycosyl hydrolase 115 family protein n=1 Tax=Novosphingobium kaempferiae TaxID=2896849 RepID=UPI001E641465|nr:glycosyl hydrolase 115 family protein [Novosphingobium kaempferiae]